MREPATGPVPQMRLKLLVLSAVVAALAVGAVMVRMQAYAARVEAEGASQAQQSLDPPTLRYLEVRAGCAASTTTDASTASTCEQVAFATLRRTIASEGARVERSPHAATFVMTMSSGDGSVHYRRELTKSHVHDRYLIGAKSVTVTDDSIPAWIAYQRAPRPR